MSDALRAPWCWDLVLIGCGKSKRPEQARAFALYTGPVFAAHLAIVWHLGLPMPHVLSAQHGVFLAGAFIEPYDRTLSDLSAAELVRWNDAILALVARAAAEVMRGRENARLVRDPAYDLPIRERLKALTPPRWSFGPPTQPSVLVLAGAPYIDGWADRARALGVRVDDPLRGFDLGERRTFARRFVAETSRWDPAGNWNPEEVGWTRREQLLAFRDGLELESIPEFADDEPAPPRRQLDLNWFSEGATV